MREKVPLSALIARIAARQFGLITRRQLLDAGLTPRAITAKLHAGELIPVHNGVYALRYRQTHPHAVALAAVLACGPGAFLSHESAEALWGLRRWPRPPEVTAPHHRRRPGIRTHRTTTLQPGDVTTHFGIRTSSAARTIADTAGRRTDAQLARAVNDARRNGHLPRHQLETLLQRSPRIHDLIDPDQAPTRSQLEDAFVAFIRRYGLPMPRLNVVLHGYEVDALFAPQRLIVELDGWRFHNDRRSFEAERERDGHFREHGYETHRLTAARLTAREAGRLQRILLSRSSTG